MTTAGSLLDAALALAAEGSSVFPCRAGGKEPLVRGGFHAATTDAATIRRWWAQWPAANVGRPVRSGEVLVDLDLHRAPGVLDALRARDVALPATTTARTPRGGLHLYYRLPPGAAEPPQGANVAGVWGLDTRTAGRGYALVPPSSVDGAPYRWQARLAAMIEAPARLLALLAEPGAPSGAVRAPGARVLPFPKSRPLLEPMDLLIEPPREGERNVLIFRAACSLRALGFDLPKIERYVLAVAALCVPPLPEREARTIARSAARYAPGTPTWSAES